MHYSVILLTIVINNEDAATITEDLLKLRKEHSGKEMDITFLLRDLAIVFSIAAPSGPIGVLCIRRTLAEGRAYGIVSGLGAATVERDTWVIGAAKMGNSG